MDETKLALFGHSPRFSPETFSRAMESDQIRESVLRAIDSGQWQRYHGDITAELTQRLATRFRQRCVMLCCSGTIAVELALRGAGVRPGDEVLLAGYDFPGNFRAIEAIGATPVLVDVVKHGWTIDPTLLAPAITRQTKAIVVSHLHGQIADIEAIRIQLELARANEGKPITIIEDACQVPGAAIGDRPLGSLGDIATLSFGGSKLLTAGRGGAILTNDEAILQRIKVFSERGNDSFPLAQLQAAALIPQLESLDQHTTARLHGAMLLSQAWDQLPELNDLKQPVEAQLPAFYKYPLRLNGHPNGWNRDTLVQAIEAEGIPIGVGFRGFIRRSPRRCRKPVPLDHCRKAIEQTLLIHHSVLSTLATSHPPEESAKEGLASERSANELAFGESTTAASSPAGDAKVDSGDQFDSSRNRDSMFHATQSSLLSTIRQVFTEVLNYPLNATSGSS